MTNVGGLLFYGILTVYPGVSYTHSSAYFSKASGVGAYHHGFIQGGAYAIHFEEEVPAWNSPWRISSDILSRSKTKLLWRKVGCEHIRAEVTSEMDRVNWWRKRPSTGV